MKTITLLCLAIFLAGQMNAQQTIDFDTHGASFEWKEMANAGVAPAIIDNPHSTPDNSSSKVLHFPLEAVSAGANPWAGTWAEINQFTISGNGLIRIKIYKPVISNVGVKVQAGDSGNGAALELKQENKLVNAWEIMDFDFSSLTGSSYSRLVIMPDFSDPRTTAIDVYVDDIEFFPLANAVAKTELDDSKVYVSNDLLVCKSTAPISEVAIHSMTGAQILRETNPTGDINISGLGKGLYLVVLKSGNTFSSFKVIR